MTPQATTDLTQKLREVIIIEDIIPEILEAIANDSSPEDIFTEDQLNDWATENGYVRKD